MQLRIRAQNVEVPAETRIAIERKVRLALGRHAAGIDRAQITLSTSRDGEPAHRCRIRIRLHHGQSFAIEDHAEDPLTAVAAASWRLEHRLERQRAARSVSSSAGRRARLS